MGMLVTHYITHLAEALQEATHLLSETTLHPPSDHQVHVLYLVLLRHGDVQTPWLQLMRCELSKGLLLYGEGQVQRLWVVLLNPEETVVERRLNGFKVLQRWGPVGKQSGNFRE